VSADDASSTPAATAPRDGGDPDGEVLRYRRILDTIARIHLDPRLGARFGWSDVIQETWLEAYRDRDNLAPLADPACRARLYRMLVNNLRDRVRHERAGCRDARREDQFARALDASSVRLERYLADDGPGPADRAELAERRLRVVEAIADLPDRERTALILQRYHGWTLEAIGAELDCTAGAVAGLHARALARLRALLPDAAR